jgi:alkylation response protein AidB-like acyl-CoA dehydrogenase
VTSLADELERGALSLLSAEFPEPRLLALSKSFSFPRDSWEKVLDGGWASALLPEDSGGLGLSVADLAGVFVSTGKTITPLPLLDHVVAIPLVCRHGGEEVRDSLGPAVSGSRLVVLADAGVDIEPSLATASVSGWDRVTGRIPYVRFAQWCTDFLVPADGALVLVPSDAVDVSSMTGLDFSSQYGIATFDSAPGEVIAKGSAVDAIIAAVRSGIRLLSACELLGASQTMLGLAVEYALVREQFGRPIGSFQAIKHLLSDLYVHVQSLENLQRSVLARIRADEGTLEHESMVLKCLASRVARIVAEGSLQVHGGVGFTDEHPLHHYMKRSLSLQGLYGDEGDLAVVLAERLVTQSR